MYRKVLLGFLVSVFFHTSAHAAWDSPTNLEATPTNQMPSLFPRIAIVDSGDAAVVWIRLRSTTELFYDLWENHYDVTTGWRVQPELLENRSNDVDIASIAMNPNGNVILGFKQLETSLSREYIWRREYSPTAGGNGWNAEIKLNGDVNPDQFPVYGDSGVVDVAYSAGGNAIMVWDQFVANQSIKSIYASYLNAGVWSAPVVISASEVLTKSPSVAIDDSGNAVAAWVVGGDDYSGPGVIWVNHYDIDTQRWGAARAISTDNESLGPNVGMNATTGDAFVVWQQNLYKNVALDLIPGAINYSRYSDATASWTNQDIIYGDNILAIPQVPEIAVDNAGNAIVIWHSSDPDIFQSIVSIFTRRYNIGNQGWESTVRLNTNLKSNAWLPAVVMDSAGNAVAVWAQSRGVAENYNVLWSKHYIAGQGWQQDTQFIDDTMSDAASNVSLAASPSGNVAVTWIQKTDIAMSDAMASFTTTTDVTPNGNGGTSGGGGNNGGGNNNGGTVGGGAPAADSGGGGLSPWLLVMMVFGIALFQRSRRDRV